MPIAIVRKKQHYHQKGQRTHSNARTARRLGVTNLAKLKSIDIKKMLEPDDDGVKQSKVSFYGFGVDKPKKVVKRS